MRILILEDSDERRSVMAACLADRLSQFDVSFDADAHAFVQRLQLNGLEDVALIALDHDLEMIENERGETHDPGTGRDAAECLAAMAPVCPVIIHSTNSPAAVGMQQCLEDGGWTTHRVLPFVVPMQTGKESTDPDTQPADAAWINTVWFRACRDAIVSSVVHPTELASG